MKIKAIEANSPLLRKLPQRNKWEYGAEWTAKIHLVDEGTLHFTIRPPYWTDLASVPRPLRGAFDNGSGEFGVLVASQVHDMLYSTHWTSKDFADQLLHSILRYYGMSKFKAWLYYQAVHLFGDSAWEIISEEEMENDRKLCSFRWNDK